MSLENLTPEEHTPIKEADVAALEAYRKIKEELKDSIESISSLIKGETKGKPFRYRKKKVVKDNTPAHWNKNANAPYYREHFALELKPVLDAMLADEQDRYYRYETFNNITPSSLYLRISQSWIYLMDKLDTDGKYAKLRENVIIKRDVNGLRLSLKINAQALRNKMYEEEGSLALDKVESLTPEIPEYIKRQAASEASEEAESFFNASKKAKKSLKWKASCLEFMEQAEQNKVLHLKNLNLEVDEVIYVQSLFAGLPNFLVRANATEIKIVCSDPEILNNQA